MSSTGDAAEDPLHLEFRELTTALRRRARSPGSVRSLFDWCQAMTQRLVETDEAGSHRLSPLGAHILQDLLLLLAEHQGFMHPTLLGWIETQVLPCLGTTTDAVHTDISYQLLKLLLQRFQNGTVRGRTPVTGKKRVRENDGK